MHIVFISKYGGSYCVATNSNTIYIYIFFCICVHYKNALQSTLTPKQMVAVCDIFEEGIQSLQKSLQRSRNFNDDLLQLSRHWRLRTVEMLVLIVYVIFRYGYIVILHLLARFCFFVVFFLIQCLLKRMNEILPSGQYPRNDMVVADYRINNHRRKGWHGIVPIEYASKSGHVKVVSPEIKYMQSIIGLSSGFNGARMTKNHEPMVLGLGDDDVENDKKTEWLSSQILDDSKELQNDECVIGWKNVCECLYHLQIFLVYAELFHQVIVIYLFSNSTDSIFHYLFYIRLFFFFLNGQKLKVSDGFVAADQRMYNLE
ncbi:hypothetical protein RFI_34614 [Reticulomyxa filosa]|uniref:Uncharacterized protein n=1 Tax=Reticulomyxa filosa TaxID=46433 RepID=X6LLI1_RETFI|nr:hypothetical protein RFI_34614 [Reticulomyxa filosa]|eukprot:ETO02798.1 hypothetical protein RFI_34614 [Reticulomyxa filosa]